ncbi:MAG TPA: hypothetical protein VGV37_12860 [Aliidongia sp.]|uniref:hypothetical protein n=1 Tax=Aliidongia sp. TaxID=1914230 RepID=UPI002DDD0DC1|nr:hypothetical protein [Aliidongia sp.]HEV2675426.1 hypothetical protein [Aliidongia sp.]
MGTAIAIGFTPAAKAQTVLTATNAVNGVIAVPDTAGKPVTVRGDGKTGISLWFPYYWVPAVKVVSDNGTILETHASGQVTTLVNVPRVSFSDGTQLDLTGAQPVATTPVHLSATGVIWRASAVPTSASTADVVGVRLENNTTKAMPSRAVTFGQAFVKGDVPAGSALVAKLSTGGVLPVQMDVKARHADGSVRHAVLTIMAPAIAASSAVQLMLSHNPTGPAGAVLTAQSLLAHGYNVQLVLSGKSINTTINAATVLSAALANGTAQTWLSGPYAAEYRVSTPIDTHLRATFDIRTLADGGVMTDVTVANDYAYLAPVTYSYNAQLVDHGATVWQANGVTQGRFQEWHKSVLSETAGPHVVFDVSYLERAGAVQNFDLSSGVSASAVQSQQSALTATNTAPVGNALIVLYMGQTGGRDDVGPTTNWSANYLVAQNEATQAVMLANADAAASIPWHMRETSGLLVTADSRPGLWMDQRCVGKDCATGGFDTSSTGWTLDFAHEADLTYVPYLVTGSHFYLDQLQVEANASLLAKNPSYRTASGLLYTSNQIRGTAWNMRDFTNAAWITPDADLAKSYFVVKTANNLAGLDALYVTQRSMKAYGAIEGFIMGDHPTSTAPWEQDFVAMILSQSTARSFNGASDLSNWMTNFIAGRFINGANGYNPLHGSTYWPFTIDPVTNKTINTWAWFYNANFAGQPAPTELDGYPSGRDGYAAIGRAGNAALFSSTGSTDALQAYSYIVSQTPAIYAAFQTGNAFNINPRLPDGHVLQNNEIFPAAASGGTVTAPTSHSLLIGAATTTTLKAAPGVSILYAGTGPTTLVAANGTNYIYPGAGRNIVTGAPGTAYIKTGTGAVQINLAATDNAVDTIDNFKPGVDHIHVTGLTGTAVAILASAAPTTSGGRSAVILKVGASHSVVVRGLTTAQLQGAFN